MRRSDLPDIPPGVTRTVKPGGKTYWYYDPARAKLPGKRRRLPELGTLDWFDELDSIKREQSGEPKPVLDMRALIADYQKAPAWLQLSEGTVGSYSSALKPVLRDWRYRRPADITAPDVVALLERLADYPSAANMTLTLVKQLMSYAVLKGLRADNPARDVRPLEEVKDSAKPLSESAWAALRAPECPVAVHRLGVLGRYTGQRISDLIRMRPADRDGDWLGCTIKKLKGKAHSCLLTPEQASQIDGWGGASGVYIRKPNGSAYTEDSLRAAWNAYARTEAGKALVGFTPHDLRATKVCDERISGKTHQQIAAMVGMSIGKVMHYSKHIDQRLVARGAEKPESAPRAADVGPLGRIRNLAETAEYLRAPADYIAGLSGQLGLGARFGDAVSFTDDDIRALWEISRQPPSPPP